MATLLLIKHSLPEILPSVPAREWRLSEEGRVRCSRLAARIKPYAPEVIVSSPEPKARQTAAIICGFLDKPFAEVANLAEHDRTNVPYFDRAVFEQNISDFFGRPEELVLGRETAGQARRRFGAAMDAVIGGHPGAGIAAITHGSVISLYVAALGGSDPYPLWQRLGMPSIVVLSLPQLELVEVVEQV
jgi:broad specificity phosphatase PhoE